nr:hypothetical protein [Tanacetum cinerariifolium]
FPYYNAFLITADVPEIYMHQFWFTISKIKDSLSYKFKLDNKTFKIGVEVFREVLQICPRLPNQRTEAEEQKATRLVHETHERLVTEKSTGTRKQTSVVFKDTSTVSKKKPLDKSHKLKGVQVIGSDELKVDSTATDVSEESWGNDGNTEKSDKEEVLWIYSDDDKEEDNDNDDQSIDIEETDDDEQTELDNEDQAMDDAKKNDEDKVEEEKSTDQEPALDEQAKDDQVGVLASKTYKEKPTLFVSTSSHSVSSNYGNQFLISSPERSLLCIVKESADAKITSMVDVQIQQEIPSVLSAPLLDVLASVVPPTPTPLPIPITTITKTEAPTSTFVNPESETLSALQLRVSDLEKEVKELKQLITLQHFMHQLDLNASSSQIFKIIVEEEISRDSEMTSRFMQSVVSRVGGCSRNRPSILSNEKQHILMSFRCSLGKSPSINLYDFDMIFSQRSPSNNHIHTTQETVFKAEDIDMLLNQGDDLGNANKQPNVKAAPKQDCKPLPLHKSRGHLTVPANFFFNNDLEYLRGGSTNRLYKASTTKTKAVKYDVEGIEDMVPKSWSPIKKFSDGTLTSVHNTLDQMLKNLGLGYNKAIKRRKLTATDQKRSRIMIKHIDQQLLNRKIMRSLEKFVGGRDFRTDYRLLQWTV